MWAVITHPYLIFNHIAGEVRKWVANAIPVCYVDLITFPCPKPNADLANIISAFIANGYVHLLQYVTGILYDRV